MAYIALNNAYSTLASAITSAGQTSITVQTGQGSRFAVGSSFSYITLDNGSGTIEICKLTAQSGDTLTVVRGQDGTTAQASWAIGTIIECRPCAAAMASYQTLISATGALKGDGAGGVTAITASGILKGDGAGTFSAATGTDVTTLIGTNAVTNATKATNLTGGNGTTLLGSVPYQSGTDTTTQLAPNTTTTPKVLTQTGSGTNGAAPVWSDPNTLVQGVPSGVVAPFAGSSAPTGWLLCYGQAVSRSTYSDLFAAISTAYGSGDGSTTFNLPDLRGRVAAGVDNMGGSTASRITSGGSGITGTTLGATGGTETHTLTIAQMPSHTHTVTQSATYAGGAPPGENIASVPSASNTGSQGSGNAHQNTQPTMMLNYIIKV